MNFNRALQFIEGKMKLYETYNCKKHWISELKHYAKSVYLSCEPSNLMNTHIFDFALAFANNEIKRRSTLLEDSKPGKWKNWIKQSKTYCELLAYLSTCTFPFPENVVAEINVISNIFIIIIEPMQKCCRLLANSFSLLWI